MTVPHHDDPGCLGLDLLVGLAAPLWLVGADGLVVWLNEAAAGLIDLPALDRQTVLRVQANAAASAALARCRDSGRPGRATVALQAGDRVRIDDLDVRVTRAPARLSASSPPLLLLEATADRAARQEMARLTEQLVALSYAYPDLRFELRRDGTILDFATASPTELNIPAERFLNGRAQEVLPDPAGAQLDEALARLSAEEPVVGFEFTLPAPSSNQSDATFEARLVALMDGDRVLCSVRNVSERVRAEREARQSHARLLDAIESVAEGFVLFDADDRLVLCNQRYQDLFSDCRDELTPGTRFEPLLRETSAHGLYHLSPEEAEAWVEQRLELHRKGGPAMEVQLSNGRWMRIEERRTSDGGTVGVRTDITDLKHRALELAAARDAAEQANRRKSDYVHHLSHELRTPLNAVMGFAQILRDEVMGPLTNPRYREAAAQIVTAGDYMLELINNLLDLARIEAGKMELYEEASDLTSLIDVTFAMMAARADAAEVALGCDVGADVPSLYGDPTMIRQMLTNLVGNALKFTPPGGRITVAAHRNGDGTLTLSVRDTGRGMTPEQIPLALTAFSQAHDRMTTDEVGTGLGLPLTCAQVALHGGRLDIDSAPGQGTTVRLTFPADRVGVEERVC
ncbi:PAS domain-containing sensor histidine kinase [Azospirillum griseum]|uniref:histidine kinase n=1 Tax=Azospirillum griseum TaxID=2496639 RepID=A0A3S0KCG2_9PROT|nr:ATP-binding protein [Azospirillum griseum]RTR22034.1 PAS domain-containing protein [Azospirillum griseum]